MIWKWECIACKDSVLGYIEGNKKEGNFIARIKRKDCYIEVRKGTVITYCYLCGKRNVLKYNEEKRAYEKVEEPLDKF